MTPAPDWPRGWPGTQTPAARPATAAFRPGDVIRELVTLLRGHGLDRLYWSACALLAVLSVTPTLTVWTDGRYLTCHRHGGSRATWPATSTSQAAHELATLARTHPARETNPHDPASR
jgi:hypothetical protein